MYLAGDIGGTKTVLAVYDPQKGPKEPIYSEVFQSGNYPSLESIIRDFLGSHDVNVEKATFGVAGPVVRGKATITNLPWIMVQEKLTRSLGFSVTIINDLVAVSYGVLNLNDDDFFIIQEGQRVKGGSIALIAPGTGLGEAYLTSDGKRYYAFPSEGGHVDFAPTSPLEFGLLRHLQERYGHVSYERICSGKGIPNIYNYLKSMGYAEEQPWLAEELQSVSDQTPVIVQTAIDPNKECDLCRTTLRTFVSVLGAETGNLALKFMATGGVYLGGGIPPRILPALSDGLFLQSFIRKGRFEDILLNIPVKVIMDPQTALLGAACHVFREVNDDFVQLRY